MEKKYVYFDMQLMLCFISGKANRNRCSVPLNKNTDTQKCIKICYIALI